MRSHDWKFHLVERAEVDGKCYLEVGYCQNCLCDMHRKPDSGKLRHYGSHQRTKSLGLWGKGKGKGQGLVVTITGVNPS